MSEELFLPAPSKGMYCESPLLPPEQGYAQLVKNFSIRGGLLRIRPGSRREVVLSGHGSTTILWADVAENDYLLSDGNIRSASGALLLASSHTAGPVYEGRFRDQLYLFSAGVAAIRRTGSSWASSSFPYTLTTLASSELRGSTEYRGRNYVWGTDATDGAEYIEYSGLDEITGNASVMAINRFMRNQNISVCKTLTLEQGLTTGEVFVVFGDEGRVLVFSGDDPGASNWFLSAVYQTTAPLGQAAYVDVQGDIMVMGRDYIYSLRDLLTGGSRAAESSSITKPVQSLYRAAARELLDEAFHIPFAFYYPQENAVVFGLGYANSLIPCDEDLHFNGSDYRRVQFVYFRDVGAFALWDVPQMKYPVSIYDEMPVWPVGDVIASLGHVNAVGEDTICKEDELSSLSSSFFGGSTQIDYPFTAEWRSTIPTQRELRNVRVSAISPTIRIETNSETFEEFRVGVIGEGSDFSRTYYGGEFLGEESLDESGFIPEQQSSIGTLAIDPPGGVLSLIIAEEVEVGLEADFFHTYMAITGPEDTNMEVFGVTVFYEPGA